MTVGGPAASVGKNPHTIRLPVRCHRSPSVVRGFPSSSPATERTERKGTDRARAKEERRPIRSPCRQDSLYSPA